MARKMNSQKLARQSNVASQAVSRRNSPPVPTLYLMQLRTQALKISAQPRRLRLQIRAEENGESPTPVKIGRKG